MGIRMLIATTCFSLDVASWIGHDYLGGGFAFLTSVVSLFLMGLTHPCVHSLADRWAGFHLPGTTDAGCGRILIPEIDRLEESLIT